MAVEDESAARAASNELRARLERGLAERGVTKTALARRSGLGRTAVSEAFNRSASVPSARTVVSLAQALHLDVSEILEIRSTAAGVHRETSVGETHPLPSGIGRPIADFDPHDLEVHPAIDVASGQAVLGGGQERRLPAYVRRHHDRELDDLVKAAAGGQSGMVVLVGSSSTGKTRSCWEAIQPLMPLGWNLWHPFDPTRAEAALSDIERVGPRTVVWLNEAQHYLGARRGFGERIAASLRSLLVNRQAGPILVLGTLWNNYATEYTALPVKGVPDLYPQTRELLAGRILALPDTFDAFAVRDARVKAAEGDLQLAQALERAEDGRLAQYLAGAPALAERYRTADPSVRALIQSAMDALRLGVGSRLTGSFISHAAEDYLTESEHANLAGDWVDEAFQEATKQVHGNMAPLTLVRLRGPSRLGEARRIDSVGETEYRLADSLEQLGRIERRTYCPPDSFWEAVIEGLTDPAELASLAIAAHDRYRLQWSYRLTKKVAKLSDPSSLCEVATTWMEGHPGLAEPLFRQCAEMGYARAMSDMGYIREEAGDPKGAEEWFRKAADSGDGEAAYHLGKRCEERGDLEAAEMLYRQAVDSGDGEALGALGDTLYTRGGDVFESLNLLNRSILLMMRQTARALIAILEGEIGERNSFMGPWSERKEEGRLRSRIEEAGDGGDLDGFSEAAEDGARNGDTYALFCHYLFLGMKDRDQADAALERAGRDGNVYALLETARKRIKLGKASEAQEIYQALLDAGSTASAAPLANLMRAAGKFKEAEALYWQAIESGNLYALTQLGELKESMGDRAGAEEIALQAVNAGDSSAVRRLSKARGGDAESLGLWPNGLDPDGTPTAESWDVVLP
ncbi:helix-turn-helix domain-containing protein [Streptomyces sp. NPDC050264]|uniref:helix-turn-helix domain-containing protein n=1 Tax=Streptomyces sp. NPDC050264 TaxID=3155038 RepID=UPI0034128AB7